MNFDALTKRIEESPIITIFRHVHPDCDAYGSTFGLREWIRDNWPEKQVYVIGKETCSQGRFPVLDEVEDEVIRRSTAIVCDTSDRPRIDDQRALTAEYVIKLDHHPNLDPYGDLLYVNDKAAAACEIVTDYLRSVEGKTVSKKTAEYLYQGLLTDTLSFSTSNTTANTLAAAGFLADHGISIPELNRVLFDRSLKDFRFAGHISSSYRMVDPHTAVVMLSMKELEKWEISAGDARPFVSELGHVVDFDIWGIFTESKPGVWDASLRSKEVPLNDIAQKFGGGGHRNAAGIKNLSREDVDRLLAAITARRCEFTKAN